MPVCQLCAWAVRRETGNSTCRWCTVVSSFRPKVAKGSVLKCKPEQLRQQRWGHYELWSCIHAVVQGRDMHHYPKWPESWECSAQYVLGWEWEYRTQCPLNFCWKPAEADWTLAARTCDEDGWPRSHVHCQLICSEQTEAQGQAKGTELGSPL